LHTSTAGGFEEVLKRATALGEDAAQIFVKSNRQWRMGVLARTEKERFLHGKREMDLWVCAHAGYLVNPAGQREIRKKSIASLAEEIRRSEELELQTVVVHCGSRGETPARQAVARAVGGFLEALERSETKRIRLALENSAGQGACLASGIEEWGEMVHGLPAGRRAACLDTAHAFAAGFDLRTEEGREDLLQACVRWVGLDSLEVLHANDSKTDCGSQVDRHEHLGHGKIGAQGLRAFLSDPRLKGIPRIGELPPGEREDRENLAFLRSCSGAS
jgi:deoxyribonuclease-4